MKILKREKTKTRKRQKEQSKQERTDVEGGSEEKRMRRSARRELTSDHKRGKDHSGKPEDRRVGTCEYLGMRCRQDISKVENQG